MQVTIGANPIRVLVGEDTAAAARSAAAAAASAADALEEKEAVWKSISALRPDDALLFNEPPEEGSYLLIFSSGFAASIDRLQARVLAGGGSYSATLLVDGVPEYGPFTVDATGIDLDPSITVPLDAQVEVLIEDVTGVVSATFVQIERMPTEAGTIPAVEGPITGSDFTMASGKLLGRSTAATGAIQEITVGPTLSLVAGELNSAGGGGLLASHVAGGGVYVVNAINAAAMTTAGPSAGYLHLYPLIPLAKALTISALAGYVTTGAAGKKLRFGIYEDNGGTPEGGTLVCDSGELDGGTSSTAIEGAVSVTLSASKKYWLAIISDGAPTLRAIAAGSVLPLAATNLSGTSHNTQRFVLRTYGALPATCPTGTARSFANPVAIGLKVA